MIDMIPPPAEITALRMTASRHAAAVALRQDEVASAVKADPYAPSGPRPTFALTTLEQMQAQQKVVPADRARFALPTEVFAPVQPVRGTVNRVL